MKDNKQIKELRWEHRGWRKVEDGLPPEILEVDHDKGEGVSEDVLVRTAEGSIIAAWYDYNRHGWYTFGIGKERCGYEEFLTKYDDIHDDTVIEWRPIPGSEQGGWLPIECYEPKPGTYKFIEVSYIDDPDDENSRAYMVYFHDGESWCNVVDGDRQEFDYWRPLQEIDFWG